MPGGLGRLGKWECDCKNCGYCKDALIEATERIVEGSLRVVDALISPKWYEREAVVTAKPSYE